MSTRIFVTTTKRIPFRLGAAIGYVAIHLACLAILWTGFSIRLLGLFVASYVLRIIGLGLGYHRYFAHRAFRTSRQMQFILAVVGTLSSERGPLWWASTHREHHRYTDTPRDIHSPMFQGFWYSYFWFLNPKFEETDFSKVGDLTKYPELVALDRPCFNYIPVIAYGILIYVLAGWSGVIWGFCLSTVTVYHATHWIQSMSHRFGGYRRFDSNDNSRNHWLFGVLTLGEWHNNHHHNPAAARQGVAWWEFDVNYYILRALSAAGLVWDLKERPGIPVER